VPLPVRPNFGDRRLHHRPERVPIWVHFFNKDFEIHNSIFLMQHLFYNDNDSSYRLSESSQRWTVSRRNDSNMSGESTIGGSEAKEDSDLPGSGISESYVSQWLFEWKY
jgi:hypothetical protein